MSARAAVFLAALSALLFAGRASATAAVTSDCPGGNALSAVTLTEPVLPHEKLAILTDGVVAPDGASWPSSDVVVPIRRPVTFDLGTARALEELYVQIDADQPFHVETSLDRATWSRLDVEGHPRASGMLSRTLSLHVPSARYLRLSPGVPTGTMTIAEIRGRCGPGADLNAGLRVVGGKVPVEIGWIGRLVSDLSDAPAITPHQTSIVRHYIAGAVLLWLLVEWLSRARRLGLSFAYGRRALDCALGAIGVFALCAYFRFGAYYYPDFIHEHDVFHYFVGAKYFPEIGYDDLYQCSAAAEAEAGFAERIELRTQRDLRTNQLVSGADALRGAGECRARFTPERWKRFGEDVRYFANTLSVEGWNGVLRDHGFNATPIWIVIGRAIASPFAASDATVGRRGVMWSGVIGPLDPALLLLSFGALLWAFGFRTATLAAIVFALNPLSEFAWIGGGFLRELWLSTLVCGICLVRRDRPALGGASLAASAGLQLFPVACLVSVALGAFIEFRRRRTVSREVRRVLAGAAIMAAVLVPLSFVGTRADVWRAFAANTAKHALTPSSNYVGLPTALSYRAASRAELLFDEQATDPFARVRAARRENLRELWFVELAGVGLGLFGLIRCLWNPAPAWWAATLGLLLVPFCIETSCYYAAWLAVVSVLGQTRRAPVVLVLGALGATLYFDLTIREPDVRYAYGSWALVAGAFAILFTARSSRDATD